MQNKNFISKNIQLQKKMLYNYIKNRHYKLKNQSNNLKYVAVYV